MIYGIRYKKILYFVFFRAFFLTEKPKCPISLPRIW